ncbi:serine/threonine-protein kinase [Paractinoplanes atraurantiacus]|uniref:non-specific serine/threonine protein kinase n=1 Tax=Paractinoplanes atraurantiacus TaxID=1036182 RepID=A0A285JMD5_9ACTN|nr:serine/threonine-protein kinase [Actinoplanes atraurantiacus]SNY60261.1 Serine/threonine protein kinase [Actinoplanes atraurantiacus]
MSRPAKLGPHDPARIGPYTTLARIGRGGQGEVYLAADPNGRRVAAKVLRVDWDPSGTLKRNLDRELVNARKVAQFVTAKVLDFDVVGELPYIISEYIEGLTLDEHVRENGPLKDSDLLQVAMQALTALEAIHQAGIVHCDFKPANIILGQGGARVIDFGIAQALDSTLRVGEIAGSFPYMAPEQIANDPLTSAADLFAWGSTMVFAATGQHAFPGDNREQLAHAILSRRPRLEGLDEPLLTSVRACLRKNPESRPTAAQARVLLFGGRPHQPPAGARPAQPSPTKVERPASPPGRADMGKAAPGGVGAGKAPPGNAAGKVAPPGRGNTVKAVAALVGAVAIAGVLVWIVPGLSAGSRTPEASTPPPTSAAAVALSLPETYEAFWRDVDCSPYSKKNTKQLMDKCPIPGSSMNLFCAQWPDSTTMAKDRPASEANQDLEDAGGWRDSWYRQDSDLHGRFYSYPRTRTPEGVPWAIWWEDSDKSVACYLQGPPGSEATLVETFRDQGFLLESR